VEEKRVLFKLINMFSLSLSREIKTTRRGDAEGEGGGTKDTEEALKRHEKFSSISPAAGE
jgi:hypothetical protein